MNEEIKEVEKEITEEEKQAIGNIFWKAFGNTILKRIDSIHDKESGV
jgi:hypothetical protein